MRTLDTLHLIAHADQLIRMKATGTPDELSNKLGISRSSWYEVKKVMTDDLNFPIAYDRYRQAYYYTRAGHFENARFVSE